MLLKRHAVTSVAALALFAFSSSAVLAATEQQVNDALIALIKSSDASVSVELGTPEVDGSDFVYSDIKIKSATAEIKIGKLTLDNAEVNDQGGLSADSLSTEYIESKKGQSSVTVEGMEITNLSFAASPEAGEGVSPKMDRVTFSSIAVSESEQQPAVKIESANAEMSDYGDGYARNIKFSVEGMTVDLATANNDPGTNQLKELGYDTLALNISGGSSWDDKTGEVNMEEVTIQGDDLGTLTFSGKMTGFTAAVIKSLEDGAPATPETLGAISFASAQLSYEDQSLTGRILEMQAKKMGLEKDAFVEQIAGALPLMLSVLENPEFQNKIAEAATAFFKDPQNISVSIAPQSPVSILQLMGTPPQDMPKLLNAEINANQ